MAWKVSQDPEPASASPRPQGTSGSRPSTLGPSIAIKGDLTGSEDLRIEGSVRGTIRLEKQGVVIAKGGRIKADIFARSISVEGEVKGNLFGEEEIVIRPSGKLEGNITAPSVTLENGAKFRGSIDMEPLPKEREKPAADKPAKQQLHKDTPARPTSAVPAPAKG
jgi:cytoskeletal protein CcmA (bactofilin family)